MSRNVFSYACSQGSRRVRAVHERSSTYTPCTPSHRDNGLQHPLAFRPPSSPRHEGDNAASHDNAFHCYSKTSVASITMTQAPRPLRSTGSSQMNPSADRPIVPCIMTQFRRLGLIVHRNRTRSCSEQDGVCGRRRRVVAGRLRERGRLPDWEATPERELEDQWSKRDAGLISSTNSAALRVASARETEMGLVCPDEQ